MVERVSQQGLFDFVVRPRPPNGGVEVRPANLPTTVGQRGVATGPDDPVVGFTDEGEGGAERQPLVEESPKALRRSAVMAVVLVPDAGPVGEGGERGVVRRAAGAEVVVFCL